MSIKSKLQKWVDADLISQNQSESILIHEKGNSQNSLFNGIRYTSFFAILLGIALIIAANWGAIGIYTKLITHVSINSLLACLIIWKWSDKKVVREVAVYSLSGLTLTLLALIGQSFHLQGNIGSLLAMWIVLITGLVVVAGPNTRIASMWVIGFIITVINNITNIIELFSIESFQFIIPLYLAVITPLIGITIGKIKSLSKINKPLSDMIIKSSVVSSVVFAISSSSMFYKVPDTYYQAFDDFRGIFIIATWGFAALFIAASFFLYQQSKDKEPFAIIAISGIFTIIPTLLLIQSPLISAIHIISFLTIMAFLASKNGKEHLVSLALFAISLRFFLVFLELFGSMFATAFGLIFAGLLFLAILKLTQKLNTKIIGGMNEK